MLQRKVAGNDEEEGSNKSQETPRKPEAAQLYAKSASRPNEKDEESNKESGVFQLFTPESQKKRISLLKAKKTRQSEILNQHLIEGFGTPKPSWGSLITSEPIIAGLTISEMDTWENHENTNYSEEKNADQNYLTPQNEEDDVSESDNGDIDKYEKGNDIQEKPSETQSAKSSSQAVVCLPQADASDNYKDNSRPIHSLFDSIQPPPLSTREKIPELDLENKKELDVLMGNFDESELNTQSQAEDQAEAIDADLGHPFFQFIQSPKKYEKKSFSDEPTNSKEVGNAIHGQPRPADINKPSKLKAKLPTLSGKNLQETDNEGDAVEIGNQSTQSINYGTKPQASSFSYFESPSSDQIKDTKMKQDIERNALQNSNDESNEENGSKSKRNAFNELKTSFFELIPSPLSTPKHTPLSNRKSLSGQSSRHSPELESTIFRQPKMLMNLPDMSVHTVVMNEQKASENEAENPEASTFNEITDSGDGSMELNVKEQIPASSETGKIVESEPKEASKMSGQVVEDKERISVGNEAERSKAAVDPIKHDDNLASEIVDNGGNTPLVDARVALFGLFQASAQAPVAASAPVIENMSLEVEKEKQEQLLMEVFDEKEIKKQRQTQEELIRACSTNVEQNDLESGKDKIGRSEVNIQAQAESDDIDRRSARPALFGLFQFPQNVMKTIPENVVAIQEGNLKTTVNEHSNSFQIQLEESRKQFAADRDDDGTAKKHKSVQLSLTGRETNDVESRPSLDVDSSVLLWWRTRRLQKAEIIENIDANEERDTDQGGKGAVKEIINVSARVVDINESLTVKGNTDVSKENVIVEDDEGNECPPLSVIVDASKENEMIKKKEREKGKKYEGFEESPLEPSNQGSATQDKEMQSNQLKNKSVRHSVSEDQEGIQNDTSVKDTGASKIHDKEMEIEQAAAESRSIMDKFQIAAPGDVGYDENNHKSTFVQYNNQSEGKSTFVQHDKQSEEKLICTAADALRAFDIAATESIDSMTFDSLTKSHFFPPEKESTFDLSNQPEDNQDYQNENQILHDIIPSTDGSGNHLIDSNEENATQFDNYRPIDTPPTAVSSEDNANTMISVDEESEEDTQNSSSFVAFDHNDISESSPRSESTPGRSFFQSFTKLLSPKSKRILRNTHLEKEKQKQKELLSLYLDVDGEDIKESKEIQEKLVAKTIEMSKVDSKPMESSEFSRSNEGGGKLSFDNFDSGINDSRYYETTNDSLELKYALLELKSSGVAAKNNEVTAPWPEDVSERNFAGEENSGGGRLINEDARQSLISEVLGTSVSKDLFDAPRCKDVQFEVTLDQRHVQDADSEASDKELRHSLMSEVLKTPSAHAGIQYGLTPVWNEQLKSNACKVKIRQEEKEQTRRRSGKEDILWRLSSHEIPLLVTTQRRDSKSGLSMNRKNIENGDNSTCSEEKKDSTAKITEFTNVTVNVGESSESDVGWMNSLSKERDSKPNVGERIKIVYSKDKRMQYIPTMPFFEGKDDRNISKTSTGKEERGEVKSLPKTIDHIRRPKTKKQMKGTLTIEEQVKHTKSQSRRKQRANVRGAQRNRVRYKMNALKKSIDELEKRAHLHHHRKRRDQL